MTTYDLNELNEDNVKRMETALSFIKYWDGDSTIIFSSPLEQGDLIWWYDDGVEIYFNDTNRNITRIIFSGDNNDDPDKYTTSSNSDGTSVDTDLNYKTDLVKLPYGIAAIILNEHPNKPSGDSFETTPISNHFSTQKQHKQQLTNIYNALVGLTDTK